MARPRADHQYVHNWHADAIGEHLEAITYGKIKPRLLIKVPPGTSKSLFVSVPIPHRRPEGRSSRWYVPDDGWTLVLDCGWYRRPGAAPAVRHCAITASAVTSRSS